MPAFVNLCRCRIRKKIGAEIYFVQIRRKLKCRKVEHNEKNSRDFDHFGSALLSSVSAYGEEYYDVRPGFTVTCGIIDRNTDVNVAMKNANSMVSAALKEWISSGSFMRL